MTSNLKNKDKYLRL